VSLCWVYSGSYVRIGGYIKKPGGKNMHEKVYHIYAKNECLYASLSEEVFEETWSSLKGMVGLMKTDYELRDLSYEECVRHRPYGYGGVTAQEPAGDDSY